jgi:hypothetical protein
MPATDPRDYRLDARPDRIDFRDYEYRAPLSSLPAQFPEDIDGLIKGFADAGMVLDQGPQGACTGFGLAATVHHLLWCKRDCDDDPRHRRSARGCSTT